MLERRQTPPPPGGRARGRLRQRCRPVRAAACAGLAFLLAAPPAAAQRYGRWWWDGAVGFGQRHRETLVGGERSSRFDQQEIQLDFALNGFVVHPALGDFRLALDLNLADIEGGRVSDSNRLGVDATVNLLPRGKYPSHLFFRQRLFDYGAPETGDAFTLLGLADASTEWGGRVRLRQGPLRGTLLGFEHTAIDFLDPAADTEVQGRHFVDWSGASRRLKHHLRLQRQSRHYGTIDLGIEDYTANFDQRGDLFPGWQWELNGVAVRRDIATAGFERGSDDLQLRARMIHTLRQDDRLDLRYSLGLSQPDLVDPRASHALSAFYYRRLGRGWEVIPFGIYSVQSAGGLSLNAPQLGLRLSWRRRGKRFNLHFNTRASYGVVEGEQGGVARDDSLTSFGIGSTLGRNGGKLGQELEIEIAREELRLVREPLIDLPDFGLPNGGLGSEDFARARLTVSHRWDGRSLSLWAEWDRRESSGRLRIEDFEFETLRVSLQLGMRRFNVQGEVGESTGFRQRSGDQEIRFTAASARWSPIRSLSLRALYRVETRELVLLPAIDTERTEAGLTFHLGRLAIEGAAFERIERVGGGAERENMGFRWTITRRLAGWLPIVTGVQRRGVIR